MGQVETYASAEGAIVFDSTHFPVVFVTWFGTPQVSFIEAYGRWMMRLGERAQDEDTKFAIIGDTTRLSVRPGPAIRRQMALEVDRFQAQYEPFLLGVLSIVDGAFMRTVVRMTLYLMRSRLPMTMVSGTDEAYRRAFDLLDRAGIPRPADLDPLAPRPPPRPPHEPGS